MENSFITLRNSSYHQNSCPASFLTLTRGIRNAIYKLILVLPDPIVVWSGMPLSELADWHFKHGIIYGVNFMTQTQDGLSTNRCDVKTAMGVLRCHPSISAEATQIFYGNNTFCFTGEFRWTLLKNWLDSIASHNRFYLANLLVCLRRPQYVWQLPDGARTQIDRKWVHDLVSEEAGPIFEIENSREQVYPRNRFLCLSQDRGPGDDTDADPDQELEGFVENISPHLEDVFKLLAYDGTGTAPKVTISIITACNLSCMDYPQSNRFQVVPEYSDDHWLNMDLPSVLEKCRELYSSDDGKHIEVEWKGLMSLNFLESTQHTLQRNGWHVVGKTKIGSIGCLEDQLAITMQRAPIQGLVIPDRPFLEYYKVYI